MNKQLARFGSPAVIVLLMALSCATDSNAGPIRRWRNFNCCPQQCCPQTATPAPPVAAPAGAAAANPQHPMAYMAPPMTRTITTKNGNTYQLIEKRTTETEEKEQIPLTAAAGGPHDFAGTSRRAAKTSIASGVPEVFNSIQELRLSLPMESVMLAKQIRFGAGSQNSNRVDEEKRNVTVTAYIYAFKKEPDHDYHVIVGDSPNNPNRQYLNTEISALPSMSSESREALARVRDQFRDHFQLGDSGPGAYLVEVHPHMKVRITGSIFFDMDHAPPREYVGHDNLQPQTAWEIHPITSIEFEVQ